MLVKARSSSINGNNEEAKVNYELIFQDEKHDSNVRMEALEYLCKKSEEKGDEGYLLGMISKIKKESGYEERHRKFVEGTLNKLHQNRDESKSGPPRSNSGEKSTN